MTHPKYRPDIDGLRAVAVLSVVGFHAFPTFVKSGFIGVDIFFVISGFLISTIIFSSLDKDRFSFLDFYSRRVRRIFPALIAVLVACLGIGWFFLLADEYAQLGKHIAGGSAFVSNFILWGESGYFDTAAETKPLLHLWSLGIEEQFYLLYPLILWVAWRFKVKRLAVISSIAALSFAINIVQQQSDPVATFYSPQTRFWELMLGSLLAYAKLYSQLRLTPLSVRFANLSSFAGLALMASGFLYLSVESAFPGWWALLPSLGATLLIVAGGDAWFNRAVLSNRLLVWVGLISYPLYLWHWAYLSFARVFLNNAPSLVVTCILVALSILSAWLTHLIVEKPLSPDYSPVA
jgi:peptidoglycan/LPS O-acetylase OafA/YrhL